MRTWGNGSAGKHEKPLQKLGVAIGTYSPTEEGRGGILAVHLAPGSVTDPGTGK